MSEQQFKLSSETVLQYQIMNNDTDLNENEVVDLLNRQTRIIKGQDLEIQRLQNLAMAMSGVLREEFGVYDVFDRTKDKKI